MSAIGTDRLCRPVGKHFGYWRRSGGAAVVPVRTQPKLCKESLGHRHVQSCGAFVAHGASGAGLMTDGGVRIREDEPKPRMAAALHRTP